MFPHAKYMDIFGKTEKFWNDSLWNMGNLKSGEKWQIRFHYHEEKLSNRLDHQITTSKLVKPERNSIADPIHK